MLINRIFGAMTLKVGALESSDVGAFIGGYGLVGRRLEKFLQAFETAKEKKKENSAFCAFYNEFIYSGKHQIRISLNSSLYANQIRVWFATKSGFGSQLNPDLARN